MTSTALMLFTRDLRVHDNPALHHAVSHHENVIPAFIVDPRLVEHTHSSANRYAYLEECLEDLHHSLVSRGSYLVMEEGPWLETATNLAQKHHVDCVYWSRDASAWGQTRDSELSENLKRLSIGANSIHSHGVVDPDALSPASSPGHEFKVFTPYYRKWLEIPRRQCFSAPEIITSPRELTSDSFGVPQLFGPEHPELSPDREVGGETLSRERFDAWIDNHMVHYDNNHDDLAADLTSHTSSALHFGTLSANEIVNRLTHRVGSEPFIRQLCWRDFYLQVLYRRPDTSWSDYVDRNDVWNDNPEHFSAWCHGKTGYPLVDAAMRQLMQEGFMHNRARMVVASFLTKDLYIDWRKGARWFMTWLTDGDLANNNLNWQWTAGTGTDTNPHRIFNPIRQSERFDPKGVYIRKYVPELKNVPDKDIHFPHHLRERLDTADLLGDYPLPIVDHGLAIAEYREKKSK
jgi:deoxyribodipyrimidine photo-lyase